jgi:flagellar hook-basal body complex protein FliE
MAELFVQRTSPLQQLKEFESKQLGKGEGSPAPDFRRVLEDALAEVNEVHKNSNTQVEKLLAGDITDVHSAMIALQKADLSFQMVVQVRNKLVDAYHEIMRMQV